MIRVHRPGPCADHALERGRELSVRDGEDVTYDGESCTIRGASVGAGAGDRFGDVELDALVQSVVVTDDVAGAVEEFRSMIPGSSDDDVASTPYGLIGTLEMIVEKLLAVRERLGISYFAVRDLRQFAPVIHALRLT